jgi:formylglycine-generating enzyme required for sulfatase activity
VLRRGQGIPAHKKVLIVLDQFEQWLHAKQHEENTDLVQALRQCDGVHLQCVVMVRDDFWMAATRFMRELEIRLVDGQNSAAVDLFPVRHAKKVLAAFGRAFGAFPDNSTDASKEQKLFLEQAVSGLAQENKVISVRLALFAEMMKGKSWTPATLKEVGGAQGVGVAFLEEAFSAATARPEHRFHQKAARTVLKALLPESGADLKGHMRSYAELLEASGYGSRPQDFDDLIRILDGEIRLITPTDPEGKEATESSTQFKAGGKYYQLTHDYLVHSLRDWLTQKQRETRRGRAELRLAERSAAWNAKPHARFLPSWWEWPNILLFTQHRKWTAPQRRVMRAAAKYHGVILSVTVAVVAVAGFITFDTIRRVELRRAADLAEAERTRALDLAKNVFTATADGVPYALRDLRPLGTLAVGSLREHVENENADFVQRLHAAYALADAGLPPREFLLGAIPIAPASESQNLFAALSHIQAEILPTLSRLAEAAAEPAHQARYAIVALHLGDPQPAQDLLDFREDPIHRTTLIHTYASWHGDLSAADDLLAMKEDAAFRSGLCAAMGTIPPELLQPIERDAATRAFEQLFREAPDAATHSSAGWALRQWKRDLPAMAPQSRPSSDRHWFVNREGMTMVEVDGHKYTMGTTGTWGNDFDKSAHEVTLSHAFYLGDREVTIEQFRRCVDDSRNQDSDKLQEWPQTYEQYGRFSPLPDCPAVSMSWFEALIYCNWLSVREGRRPCYTPSGEKEKVHWAKEDYYLDEWRCDFTADGYRLPTEAEWECAARAGSNGDFCFGSDEDLLPRYAWFIVNGKSRTWPGGAKLPNAWGLFDVHGNVWEWCWDWMDRYGADAVTDPVGPAVAAAGSARVIRGGSYNHSGTDCRVANRREDFPLFRSIFYGFRVCCGR